TASGSFLSGVMLGSGGWALLNHLALLAVAVVAAALLWLAAQRRRAVGAG
ncbi:MAG: MFS transporter, partial [Proteobacteria bacterium]|nr:MFS transporter [Pseudomonadota bacterium]